MTQTSLGHESQRCVWVYQALTCAGLSGGSPKKILRPDHARAHEAMSRERLERAGAREPRASTQGCMLTRCAARGSGPPRGEVCVYSTLSHGDQPDLRVPWKDFVQEREGASLMPCARLRQGASELNQTAFSFFRLPQPLPLCLAVDVGDVGHTDKPRILMVCLTSFLLYNGVRGIYIQ